MTCLLLITPIHKEIVPKIKDGLSQIHFPIKENDFNGRAYIWKKSLPQLRKSILWGVGPGNYAMGIPQREHFGDLIIDRPHNLFLNTWISTGLISLLILLTAIASVLSWARDPSLEASIIGFLIAGLFTDSVLSVTPYFLIFLGALTHKTGEV